MALKGMKKVAEKRWQYVLYELDGDFIVSVLCGSVGFYELNIPLSPEEVTMALGGDNSLDQLVRMIRDTPGKYAERSVDTRNPLYPAR